MFSELFSPAIYSYNPAAIPVLIAGFINLSVGIFVFFKNRRSIINISYFCFALSLAVWLIGFSIAYSMNNPDIAFAWYRHFAFSGIIFLAPTYIFFTITFVGAINRRRIFVVLNFIAGFMFYILTSETLLLSDKIIINGLGYYLHYAIVGKVVFIPWFSFLILYGFYLIWKKSKETRSRAMKRQYLIILLALMTGSLAMVDHLVAYGVRLYPIGYISVTIFALVIAYMVIRYKIMSVTTAIAAETIVSTMPDLLIIINKDQSISFANQATLKILDYKNEDIFAEPIGIIFPEYDTLVTRWFSQKTQPILNCNSLVKAKNGENIPVDMSIAEIIQDKEAVGYVIVAKDMRKINRLIDNLKNRTTELKRLQDNLEEKVASRTAELISERDKTNAIISNMVDPILVVNNDMKLVLANQASQNVLKLNTKAIGQTVGAKNSDLAFTNFKGLSSINFNSKILNATPDGKVWLEEVVINGNKPGLKPLNPFLSGRSNYDTDNKIYKIITVPVVGKEGQKYGYMKIFYNMTRERLLDQMKSEFISVAAHQLRTPLSAIKWSIKMVLDGDVGKITKQQIAILNKGYVSNERVIKLVNQMLNVSRIEEGKFGYSYAMSDFLDIIRSNVNNIKDLTENKNLKINLKLPDKPININMDKEKINMAIQNLIDNAILYSPENNKIDIEVRQEDNSLAFTIKDSGLGIPKNDQDKIGTKFFRSDNVLRVQTDGSGLGLYITRNIIEGHGGTLDFESTEGVGSVFTIKLPLAGVTGK